MRSPPLCRFIARFSPLRNKLVNRSAVSKGISISGGTVINRYIRILRPYLLAGFSEFIGADGYRAEIASRRAPCQENDKAPQRHWKPRTRNSALYRCRHQK